LTELIFDPIALAYDQWFERHKGAYQSELEALSLFVPSSGEGLEVGVGTGRFASALGVSKGIEPAANMAAIARSRGIEVTPGVAEELPYAYEQFDFVLMVTVDCFVQDVLQSYKEAHRVLKPGGLIIIGLLDKNGVVARKFETRKAPDNVYWHARFHTPEETFAALEKAGFGNFETCQTLMVPDPKELEYPKSGHGEGSFVVIKGLKPGRLSLQLKLNQINRVQRGLRVSDIILNFEEFRLIITGRFQGLWGECFTPVYQEV